MRWCVSIGMLLAAGAIAVSPTTVAAASDSGYQLTEAKPNSQPVDVELVIAVDVSYSMDLDELAIQRDGYAQAIVSQEFLQALKAARTAGFL